MFRVASPTPDNTMPTGTIRLPEYELVIFEESPLEDVICQLRFHQILKIAAAPPAEFQEKIRSRFPVLSQEQGFHFGLAGSQPIYAATNEPVWQFKTTDEKWIVSLTSQSLALRTLAYKDFEGFLAILVPVLEALEVTYQLASYIRIGLRYVNQLVISRENDRPVAWNELLNKHMTSAFGEEVLCDGIVAAIHHVVLQTERGQVNWRYTRDTGETDGASAERFMLDLDHFLAGNVVSSEVQSTLGYFNDTLYRLFRWCLTDKGFQTLKPKPKTIEGGAQ